MKPALQTKKKKFNEDWNHNKNKPRHGYVVGRTDPKTPASRSLHKSAHPSCQIFEWMFISEGNGELFQAELLNTTYWEKTSFDGILIVQYNVLLILQVDQIFVFIQTL